VAVVDQYTGGVDDTDNAEAAIAAMGAADIALLAGHGVFVLGDSVRQVHQRAVAIEQRAHRAWFIENGGGSHEIPPAVQDTLGRAEFFGFWEAMARRELLADPELRTAIDRENAAPSEPASRTGVTSNN
jgi:ribulose-5-phosphate 4-epimerase/fuculose-1-phosphate aldolase